MITPITSAAREAPESERDGYAAIRERFELGNVLHDADGVMIYQGVDRDTNYEISDHGTSRPDLEPRGTITWSERHQRGVRYRFS